MQGKKLKLFQPQGDYLKSISLGEKRALADKFGWSIRSPLLWYVKN